MIVASGARSYCYHQVVSNTCMSRPYRRIFHMRAHDPARTDGPAKKKGAANRAAAPLSAAGLLALQQTAGNAAVTRYVQQARAGEQHEHRPGCGHGGNPASPLQRSAVHDVLASAGRPLDAPVRAEMEARLGADFSDVRVHTGDAAERSADEIGARAYTSDSHVVIGEGGGDKRTLAHELTHVIQQRQGPVAGTETGDALRISDPSDRFERAAEENAHRVMSGPAPVQHEAVDAGRGPSTAGGEAAVQRTFKMANKTYSAENAEELTAAMFDKAQGGQKRWTGEVKKTVVAKALQMAEAKADYGRFGTYTALLNCALQLVNQATAADLPAVAPGAVRTGSPEPMEGVEPMVEILDTEKISRLANFRRRASDVGTKEELDGFRDTTKMVSGFTYKHVSDNQYTIGHTGNFLLGGPVEHTYEELFAAVRTHTGLTDTALAPRFVRALSDPGDAFEGLPDEGRKYCAKVVAVIQGAEFRRAAGNPTVAIAAFNKVVTTPGLTLEKALSQYAIFAVTGGSAESQFHRKEVPDTQELRERALNEYDALARLVSDNGFTTDTEEEFLKGCQHVAQANMNAFKQTFSYR